MDETNKKVIMHLQSAQNRLLIKNGQVVNHDKSQFVDVYIEDGIIKQIGNHLIIPGGTRVIDANGKLVLPGGIDPNVHFQTPIVVNNGTTQTRTIDDFYVGTKAALAGGTTTVIQLIEQPSFQKQENNSPLLKQLENWQLWAEEKACCDYAFKIKLSSSNLSEEVKNEVRELTRENHINCLVASMKDFQDEELIEFFELCASSGCLAQVVTESPEIIKRNTQKLMSQSVKGPEGYVLAHSEEAEEEATLRACTLAHQINCPLYLAHISCPATTAIIASRQNKGHVVFGEVTPAALACNDVSYWDKDWKTAASLVASPPIRKEHCAALADALAKELGLDLVGSNHAAFNSQQKALGLEDFSQIPVGTNGVEERLSVVWNQGIELMSAQRFVAVTSSNAAKMFGLYPDKGHIEVGSQADIVIWDPEAFKSVCIEDQCSKSDLNIFHGLTFKGRPDVVILRGKVVLEEGEVRAVQGHGRALPLSPYPTHVYQKIKERQIFNFVPVERKEQDFAGEVPPPLPTKSYQPEKAASLHISNIDLKSHPNNGNDQESSADDVILKRSNRHRSSIRIKNPPGGRATGSFW